MGHSNRFLPYLVGAAAVAAGLLAAGIPWATVLPFAVALACPLAMVVMMRGMHGGHGGHGQAPARPADPPVDLTP